MSSTPESPSFPTLPFSSLPLNPSGPQGNAWGRFGKDDHLGMLNLLTPSSTVTAAREEIRTGLRVSLDWPIGKPFWPCYGRQPVEHKIIDRTNALRGCNDDVITFNTQSGSQWDGFRHYGYPDPTRFYAGTTSKDIASSTSIGIDRWVTNGGIVGRGVLLDYASWAVEKKITLSPLESVPIPVDHYKSLIKEEGIEIRTGDILFVRTGFTTAFDALSPEEQKALSERPTMDFAGLESTEDSLKWLWECQFAAVAGDAPAFERSPVGAGCNPKFIIHQWLLAGWGMPIGELFDLEELALKCKELKRHTFFVSSVPLKVPGGVASPPNAIAIF